MTGRGLPRALRGQLESLLGTGLGDVRIHESGAPGVGVACTRGNDIWFAPGVYRPHDPEGLEILGHELAHVIQQRAGRAGCGTDGPALEAEACRVGGSLSRGEPVHLPRPRGPHAGVSRAVTQFYTVVPFAQWGVRGIGVPAPSHHDPRHATNTFPGQTKGGGASPKSFLRAPGVVNLVSTPVGPGATLRVSHSGTMAIEHCDLNVRQPKAFYATDTVIEESNARLELIGARYRLAPDPDAGQRIVINGVLLRRVLPGHINGSTGLDVTNDQNCDQMVQYVVGNVGALALAVRCETPLPLEATGIVEYGVARNLVRPTPPPLDAGSPLATADTMRAVARPYGELVRAATPEFTGQLRTYGLNQFAAAETAEGFVTATLTVVPETVPLSDRRTQVDHARYQGGRPAVLPQDRVWGAHYGGVVAKDGTDVVTLENHARNGEDDIGASPVGYYFQMYDTHADRPAQSWHNSWAQPHVAFAGPAVAAPHLPATAAPATPGSKTFTNPLTMRLTVPDHHWDVRAEALHGAARLETIKDRHTELVAGASADTELRTALMGLRYANVRLADRAAGRRSRVTAWIGAVDAARARTPHRQNLLALQHILRRLRQMDTH